MSSARLELGLTQEQAAQALGIDVRTYRRYEAGEVNDPVKGFSVRRAGRRQLLARIGAEFGIGSDELLDDRTEPSVPTGWRPKHVHVIQPAHHFVGRRAELDILRAWATEPTPSPRVRAIVAVGGSGKSALVERLLRDTPPEGAGQFVWSFYDDPRAEVFLSTAYAYLCGRAAPNSTQETLDGLIEALEDKAAHLWVLDGFETMQSNGESGPRGTIVDPYLRRLLLALTRSRGGARMMVTSRYLLADLGAWEGRQLETLRLAPLDIDAQAELLLKWGIAATGPVQSYLERFGGHALSIATLASYVSTFCAGELSAVDEIDFQAASGEDVLANRLARLLDAYAQSIGDARRDLLSRLAAFPRGTDVETLVSLAKAAPDVRGTMPTERRAIIRELSHLETLGLVYQSRNASSVFAAHPFVAAYFRERLGDEGRAIHGELRVRLIERLENQPRSAAGADQLDLLEDLLVHTLMSGRRAEAFSVYRYNFGGFGGLGLVRGEMARGFRIVRAFTSTQSSGPAHTSVGRAEQGELAYDSALYAIALGDLGHAERSLVIYRELMRSHPRHLTTGLRTSAYALRLAGNYEAALRRTDEALRAASDHGDHRARAMGLQGAILTDMGDLAEAGRCFNAARAEEPTPRFRRALWEAEYLVSVGEFERAKQMTEANRVACEARGWSGHVSHCDVVLGTCAQNDVPRAREHLERARGWANGSGEIEARLRCDELGVHILMASGEHEAAKTARAEAIQRATNCGFGRFVTRLEVGASALGR